MRSLPSIPRCIMSASVCTFAFFVGSAQTFAASTGTGSPAVSAFNSAVRPPVPGHHRNADEKLIYARVRDGVYTVDGMVAKIKLNYDVQGANFMYLFVPGVGTAVVSVSPEPDALMTTAALERDELTFTVDGHRFNLTGVSLDSSRGEPPAHLYVRLDRSAWRLSRMPMIGFGNRAELPYEWPGALPPEHVEESQAIPPVPSALLPRILPAVTAPVPASPTPVNPASLHPVVLR